MTNTQPISFKNTTNVLTKTIDKPNIDTEEFEFSCLSCYYNRLPKCVRNIPNDFTLFQNWGGTVNTKPKVIFYPRNKLDIISIVKYAKSLELSVRCIGYRHTWTDMYADNNQIYISMIPKGVYEKIHIQKIKRNPKNDLQDIQIIETSDRNALCKIGASVTNEQFRKWCLDPEGGQWKWTIPLNVILVEITFGGSNATICHGAGITNKTLSDLVYSIEFVNANGELQVVNDPQLLKTAAGCFGLLGVVTSITLKLDKMTYARMIPTKPSIFSAIPPPGIDLNSRLREIPEEIRKDYSDNLWETDTKQFIDQCENSYYAEWFWFPYSDKCWVNCWNNDANPEDARLYPHPLQVKFQNLENALAQKINDAFIGELFEPDKFANIRSNIIMNTLPDKEIITPLIDAIHFRRGVHNMPVRNTEFEIPIPLNKEDNLDWNVVQKAWWLTIQLAYQYKTTSPINLTIEMRIMGGSNITLAPQNGHLATCSIEILSVNDNLSETDWKNIKQEFFNRLLTLTDFKGNYLIVKPHWAKEWQGLSYLKPNINYNNPSGKISMINYLKDIVYPKHLETFREDLSSITNTQNITLEDLQNRFSNSLFNNLVFDK